MSISHLFPLCWQIRRNALKFKTSTLQHYDCLHKIFGGSAATGKYACNSNQPPLTDEGEAELHHGVEAGNAKPANGVSSQDDMSISTRMTGGHKSKQQPGPRVDKGKQKKKGRNDVYDTAMQVISESSVWRGERDKSMSRVYDSVVQFSAPPPPSSDPESVMEMLLGLKGTPGIDEICFANACANLESVFNRRMFAAMDDESRVVWMKYFTPSCQQSNGKNQRAQRNCHSVRACSQPSRGSGFVGGDNRGRSYGGQYEYGHSGNGWQFDGTYGDGNSRGGGTSDYGGAGQSSGNDGNNSGWDAYVGGLRE